jgi:hypothetical protein
MTKTADGSEAVHFVDRTLADHAALVKQERARDARLLRIVQEDARAALIDEGKNPRQLTLSGISEPSATARKRR